MKILLINDNYFPILSDKIMGGAERTLIDMATILTENGHEVFMSSSADSSPFLYVKGKSVSAVQNIAWESNGEPLNSKYYLNENELSTRRDWRGAVKRSIIYAMEEYGIDLIVSHTKTPSLMKGIMDARLEYKIPTIAIIHNLANFGMLSVETNKVFREMRDSNILTVTVSEASMINNNGCIPDCCEDYICLQYTEGKEIKVEEERGYNIIFSRITPFKNIPLALLTASYSKYPTKFYTTSFSGDMKGKELYDLCMTNIKNSNGKIELHLDESHSEIMKVLSGARCQILTSLGESASLTTFESSLLGVPTCLQVKNDLPLAPHMFMSDYFSQVNTYRKREDTAAKMIADLVDNIDTSLEKRVKLSKDTVAKFSKEAYIKDFFRVAELARLKTL